MVAGRHKSKSMRKVFKRTPGGKTVVSYEKKKPKIAHCSSCGAKLIGVPRERAYKMQNMPKTKKRPQRPFGGALCSKCARQIIIKEAHK